MKPLSVLRSVSPVRLLFLLVVLLVSLVSRPLVIGQGDLPRFETAACPFEVPSDQQVDCGYLIVPESRDLPNSPEISLAVAIIRSPNGNPEPDPLVYLEGGPGGSALYGIDAWYATPFGTNRDIILIDQRGTGYSEPFLGCTMSLDLPDDADDVAYAAACRDALTAQGVNLAAYNSAASAADLNDLRLVLGYDQLNLYGVSYGTRLALTMMRDYPDALRSVVLDSSYPPQVNGYEEQAVNADRAFDVLFAGCAADAACNNAYPDLEQVFYATVAQLDDDPALVDFGEGEQEFYGSDLINLLFDSMYSTWTIPYLPAVIYEASAGSFDLYFSLEEEGDDEVTDGDFVEDFTDDSGEEAVYLAFEDLLLDYLEYDDYDELYDYLDNLSDEDYFALLDTVIEELSDADFDGLLLIYLGYDDEAEMYDYLDSLSDDEFDAIMDDFYAVLYGEYEETADRSDADGLFNSVECYEELTFNRYETAETLAADLPPALRDNTLIQVETQHAICAIWGAGEAPARETETVRSDLPTLVLAGEYDPITPPAWGKAAAAGLTRAYYFEFPGVGHGAIDGGDCPVQIGVDFVNQPTSEPDGSCIAAMGGPEFYTGD